MHGPGAPVAIAGTRRDAICRHLSAADPDLALLITRVGRCGCVSAAPARLSDTVLIEQLTSLRGIGRWTVEMLLIFSLGRPDIVPVDDFGVREGFRLVPVARRG